MNIGIDISQAVYQETGVGKYTIGLINGILDYDTDHNWTFLYSSLRADLPPSLLKKIKSSRHRLIHIPLPPTILSFLWNTLHIAPVELFTGTLDLFITSDWTEPPAKCKKMTIIHDLVYLRYPETVHKTILLTQKQRMKWVKKESSHVIATSDATKSDIVSLLNIPENKISTIYTGIDIISTSQKNQEEVLKKYAIKKPFMLAVGKIEPRKNIARLIDAFSKIKQEWNLVIVGQQGWDTISPEKKNENISFTGKVSEIELHALYEQCSFFVFPSLWEGFGHPVIEAMKHKKAVITSKVPSLLEVAGGNALLCDPLSIEDIHKAMQSLLADESLRSKLSEKGYMYAQQFTWKRYMVELLILIQKLRNN